MKKILIVVLVICTLHLFSDRVIAQSLPASTSVDISAYIHDPDGKPIPGATVYLVLPRYGPAEADYATPQGTTDVKGVVKLSGVAQQDFYLSAECSGYYGTRGASRSVYLDQPALKLISGVQQFDLELMPVKKPIHSIGKYVIELSLKNG